MSFGPLAPGASIGGLFRQVCTVTPQVAARDAMGTGYTTNGTALSNIPCTLQPMSTTRSMLYKSETADTVYDLFLPLRREGQAAVLSISVGTHVTVDGVVYRTIGEGMRQGQGGTQRVPVEELNQ